MAIENISNVPEVCSGMLRIAPRALHIPHSLGGGPPNPPPYLPPSASGLSVALLANCPPPSRGKIMDPPLI